MRVTSTLTDAIVGITCDCLRFQNEEELGEPDVKLVREAAQRLAESSGDRWTLGDCCYLLGVVAERIWRPAATGFDQRRVYCERITHLLATHA